MGICYSEEEEWASFHEHRRRRKNKKKKEYSSIIYEQKTLYQSSFASKVQSSFREDLHKTLGHLSSQNSIHIGSIVEMEQSELEALYSSLQLINEDGQNFNIQQPFSLCNLKTKNYLHTHKIKVPNTKLNQVSSCPYNSNHIVQYDLWKFVRTDHELYFIYHPFTQKFLSVHQDSVVCSDFKQQWRIIDFGRRRNGGFIKIIALDQFHNSIGQLCMMEQQALLPNHRKLTICNCKHVSHLWQINSGQCNMN